MYHRDEELESVLAFQALVGQRRRGHFDHDSHAVTGPTEVRSKKRALAKKPAAGTVLKAKPKLVIKLKRDPLSGVMLEA